jgi:hypothetical protein
MYSPEENAEIAAFINNLISIVENAEMGRMTDSVLGQPPRDIFEGKTRERAREIGTRLNEIDGMVAMRYVHAKVSKAKPIAAGALEFAWRGIGQWR